MKEKLPQDSTVVTRNYSHFELNNMIAHPETVSRDVYKLFTVYVWEALTNYFQSVSEDNADEEDDDFEAITPNGKCLEISVWNSILNNCINDLNGAASTKSTLQIKGQSFRIPNGDYPMRKLRAIFHFYKTTSQPNGEEIVVIYKYDLKEIVENGSGKSELDECREDRLYFKKIVYLAESSDDNWDKLTDMEAAIYYWGFILAKYEGNPVNTVDIHEALTPILKETGIDRAMLESCMRKPLKRSEITIKTQFSATKVREWNKKFKQSSIVDKISKDEAEKHWSNTNIFKTKN